MSVTFFATTDKVKSITFGHEVDSPVPCGEKPNFANSNAVSILNALGLEIETSDLYGKIPIDQFHAALDILGAYWDDEGVKFTRQDEIGERFISFGLDEEGLLRRIKQLRDMVVIAKRNGATHIVWT